MRLIHPLLSTGNQAFGLIDESAAEKSPNAASDPSKKQYVERLNVQVPEFLGKITRKRGILLVYISTGTNPKVRVDNRLYLRRQKSAVLS